jgi:hypothetical protein
MPNPTLFAPLMLVAMLAPLPAAPSANDAPAAPSPQEAAAHADSKWEALALKKRASTQTIPGGVVCIGSSHMANWKNIQNDLKPLTVFNLGIGGSRMVHASEIFLPVLAVPAKPRAVILYEGSNDLNAGDTPEAILEHFTGTFPRRAFTCWGSCPALGNVLKSGPPFRRPTPCSKRSAPRNPG